MVISPLSMITSPDCRLQIADLKTSDDFLINIYNRQSAICNFLTYGRGPIEWKINEECAAEHQALGDQAPAAAVGAGGAVVSQAQVMAGLDVHGPEIQGAKRSPLFGLGPIHFAQGNVRPFRVQ